MLITLPTDWLSLTVLLKEGVRKQYRKIGGAVWRYRIPDMAQWTCGPSIGQHFKPFKGNGDVSNQSMVLKRTQCITQITWTRVSDEFQTGAIWSHKFSPHQSYRRLAKEHRAYSLIVLPRHFLDEGEVIRFAYNQNLPGLL